MFDPEPPGLVNGHATPYADRFGQIIAVPQDLPLLRAALTLLCSLRDGRIPPRDLPGALERAALTKRLDLYRDLAVAGARRLESRAARYAPAPGARPAARPQVGGGAHAPAPLAEDEITTVEASRKYGLSDETWRRMARDGTVPARKAPRDAWMLTRAGVIAETERRRERGTGSRAGAGAARQRDLPAGEAGAGAGRGGRAA